MSTTQSPRRVQPQPPGPAPATTRRSRHLPATSLAFLVAVVTLAAGIGLAVPRLTEQDPGLPAWLGLAALVVGAVVSVRTAWRVLSGLRRRWWLLALPMLLLTTYLALWTVGQGVVASFPAHPALGSRTPADVGLRHELVTMRTIDDVTLAGWWVPGDNGAAVILLHGAGSTRAAVLDHAAVLASHGYGVLLLDARGHGGSEGRGMDFGWYGERDVSAAVDFLIRRQEVAPGRVGLVGLSMGGEGAIGAGGVDPRVGAVVAEGATHRVAADKRYLAAYGIRGDVQGVVDRATYAVAGLLSDAPAPRPLRESIRAAQADGTPTPLLLVTAGDVETEGLAADHMARAAPEAVRVWTVPGADHTGGLDTDHEGWERQVVGFLDHALVD